MTREDFVHRLDAATTPIITVSDPEMIRAAWGDRRISGRTRGVHLSAYPESVAATRQVWLDWFDFHAARPGLVKIVIAKKKAQARIDAALGRMSGDPEFAEPPPKTSITQEEIEDMLAERAELRQQGLFADADRMRAYLTEQGVRVQDQKVTA